MPAMARESIRRIDPRQGRSPADPRSIPSEREAPELVELVARARAQAMEREPSLACPTLPSRRHELPRFSGVTLADVRVQAVPPLRSPAQAAQPQYVTAPLPPQPRVLLGPGAMTMTLAIVATLAFGVAVVAS
jgi:hypothetical protein